MSFEIKRLTKKETIINAIIYGESGLGKTSLIKNLPAEDSLIINVENGLLSLGDYPVDFVDAKTVKDVLDLLKQVDMKKYKTVFIDSITELSQNHYTLLKKKYEQIERSENKKPGSMGIRLWGDFLEDFSVLFKTLRDLKKNVVAFSLVKEHEDSGIVEKLPDVYGKSSKRIVAWFDECLYMHMNKENERKFLTEKANNIMAKDRSGKLDKVTPADLSLVFKKIKA